MTWTTPDGRRIPIAPADGWLTLGLVMLLCLSLAWSLDDAQLVLGEATYTDFLTWTAIGGVLAGFVGASVRWGRWRTFLIGSVFAALLTPILVGTVFHPDGAPLGVLFTRTAEEVVLAWRDLIVRQDSSFTTAFGHHLLVLGLIVWASSMFASFAAFGHRRPLNGVLLIGVLLVANMSLTVRDQLVYLVVYTLAALFLLIRFHTFDEQNDWIRRRIGDPAALSGLYLRGGTVFIVAAVFGALLLTQAAASAPLAGAWTDVGGRVIEWSQFLQRYLPVSGTGRSIGPSFGDSATIQGVWSSDEGLALIWETPTVLEHPPYLAAVIYDDFKLHRWDVGESTQADRAAGAELLADTQDAVTTAGRKEYEITVTPTLSRGFIFAPEMPLVMSGDGAVQLAGGGYLAKVLRSTSNEPYTVTSLIRADEKDGGATINKLRVAGQEYPPGMLEQYGRDAVPEGTFTTQEAKDLLDEMEAAAGDNPYDLAAKMVETLQDGTRFSYDTNVQDLRCDLSIVDCFARYKAGYCEYYASSMAMMLRELDIPARLVEGFLPGTRIAQSNRYEVRNSDSHAWVQVYFPGYGWIDFDPTGGQVADLAPLPTGAVQPSAGPSGASASRGPLPERTFRDIDEGAGGSVNPSGRNSAPVGPLIAATALLAIIVGSLSLIAWRRGPRGPVTPDGAYGMVTRLASRLGFAPRPNQTVYEYAGVLAELLPDARPELETVARAKVEVAYGGRRLGADRMASLREAQRRLRTSLLRLAFRRADRRRRRRGGR
jgi:transglutaminase-like putative cysteine protease